MVRHMKQLISTVIVLAILGALGWAVFNRLSEAQAEAPQKKQRPPSPVEVVGVEHGPIEQRRVFSGTLEATADFVVAPKIGGRIEMMTVDLADPIKRGQVVAELDDGEYVQAVAQAEADLAVAEANLAEARSAAEIARRELERMSTLQERGVASESQFDTVRAQQLAKDAAVNVAKAQVARANASLETARIRLGYTRVSATWAGGNDVRVVSERHADVGDTIAANTALLSIVELNPINAVMFVTEKDYGNLKQDQNVTLTTDAYGNETFAGKVTRVSPVFRRSSRQARVELSVDNPDQKLKPGMFVRARVRLARAEDATIVPDAALVKRSGQTGVFLVNEAGDTVTWRAVREGIREGDRVQVTGIDGPVEGRVVTLGQQLVNDGSKVLIPDMKRPSEEEVEALAAEATR